MHIQNSMLSVERGGVRISLTWTVNFLDNILFYKDMQALQFLQNEKHGYFPLHSITCFQVTMVFLESISTFCCVTVRRCACCKKNEMKCTQNITSQTVSMLNRLFWKWHKFKSTSQTHSHQSTQEKKAESKKKMKVF
jgi:hypothetical protein